MLFRPTSGPFRANRVLSLFLVLLCASNAAAVELPGAYYKLMNEHVTRLEADTPFRENLGAMFAAAVLYTKQHPANAAYGDKKKLEVALKLGAWAADYGDGGPSYIPTQEQYPAGRYEVSMAFCDPDLDIQFSNGVRKLLG